MFLRPLGLLPLLLLVLAPFAFSAEAVTKGPVTVELVAHDSSIQPGRAFWVALKMDHEPHWHSYWIDAGTGYPTSLDWTLPEGFTASPLVWALPRVVKDSAGNVAGNGHEGQTFHFVRIAPPANIIPGANVTLKASADWLMCKNVCMPGGATLELTLPVRADPPAPNMAIAQLFNSAFAALPKSSSEWTFAAVRDGAKATLHLAPVPGQSPATPADLHYFDENGAVDYAKPQYLRAENGGYLLELELAADAPTDAGLKGVLAGHGLLAAPGEPIGYGGVLVDAPFATSAASAPASAARAPASASDTIAGTLLLAFLGGLVLNLMPCVFPVIGLKILGFVKQSGSSRGKVVQHGIAFTAGVLLSFWALTGLLLVLRAGGAHLGWGFQLQSPAFVFGMAVFLFLFALNLSGLFEIGLSASRAGASLHAKEGMTGSFLTGALATLVATPCSAPFLAPALGAALTLTAVESLLVFTAIAVGLATPYLLLSIFPHAVRILPRPGAWMETFKQLMAFPLYATVGWLLWVLAAQTAHDENALLGILFALVIIAMAAWAYGRFGQAHGKPRRQWLGRIAALSLTATGLALGWPHEAPAAPPPGAQTGYQIVWEKWSPQAVAAAQAAGKFAYVDFTARWCFTCQTNKAAVFSSADVLDAFETKDVALFKADWTNKDAHITQELARWNRSAVPLNLFYAPGREDPIILPELLLPGTVLDVLAQASRDPSLSAK